ncbi:MAG: hypothetical protein JJ971_05415 [Balneolaceae bacterium]|nr:hypothetical protein [Balneolaceae bacterium]MBO6545815.1 hypothetical protein [Balneolaceae bacterium]MBO6647211.1 hypothetical protein [Balneolaceae bacterium]
MRLNIFILVLLFISCTSNSTLVNISNESEVKIDTLEVFVTGNTYLVLNILPKEKRELKVDVTGESDIEIRIKGRDKETVEVYLEPGSGGIVDIGVNSDSLVYFFHRDI